MHRTTIVETARSSRARHEGPPELVDGGPVEFGKLVDSMYRPLTRGDATANNVPELVA